MRHCVFQNSQGPFIVAFLIKELNLKESELQTHYLQGMEPKECVGFSLDYGGKKKPSAATCKTYLNDYLLPAIKSLNICTLYCADAEYFKKLTKQTKAEPHLGYVLPCALEGYEHLNIIYGINYQSLFYAPSNLAKLTLSLKTLRDHLNGKYQAIGTDIIKFEKYPSTIEEIRWWLGELHKHPVLTCDIETRSLHFHEAGLETISFAWGKHEGIAFCIEKANTYEEATEIKRNLKQFFVDYTGKVIYHNATYDIQIIIYELWMKPL